MPTRKEIEFIKSWIAVAGFETQLHAERGRLPPSATYGFTQFEEPVGGAQRWVLTPRGADLVATARGLDLDALIEDDGRAPERLDPHQNIYDAELVDCPDCEGRGRVPAHIAPTRTISQLLVGGPVPTPKLEGWDVGCEECGGSGKVPAGHAGRVIVGVDLGGRDRTATAVVRVKDGKIELLKIDGWLRLRAPGVVEELEGRRIEVKSGIGLVPAPGLLTRAADASIRITYENGGASSWPRIPDLLVRAVDDDWAREPEAIRALLREALETGREIDAQWVGGERLEIDNMTRVLRENHDGFSVEDGHRCMWNVQITPTTASDWLPVLTAVRWRGSAQPSRVGPA